MIYYRLFGPIFIIAIFKSKTELNEWCSDKYPTMYLILMLNLCFLRYLSLETTDNAYKVIALN